MQTLANQADRDTIDEAEYQALEQTLSSFGRGRQFLAEYLNRNKSPDSQEILSAIYRLEKTVTRQRKVPDLNQIRLDIADMHEAIERTKLEIANIKAEGADSNRFTDASHELDAIVTQTEGATQSILEAAERIQEQAWTLREKGADESVCDDIDGKATEIFMACSFQDLTGQRTNKVVQVLRYLESRINLMINIWGIDELAADATAGPLDNRPDAHLLNGPQLTGRGVSQSNVDELMSASDDLPETALTGDGDADPGSPEGMMPEPEIPADMPDIDAIMAGDFEEAGTMDADAIDKLFASTAEPETVTERSTAEPDKDDFAPPASNLEDDTLDEEAIAKLFEAADVEEAADARSASAATVSEAEADTTWEASEAIPDNDGNEEDPLARMTEIERQALFS
ncbi:protein phosphatase CheZ [Roseibium sp. RKSG952]|uniref:protein phosphatase CheZ n=1 Tax=Roseibium sp. RKSG952 TaxID=2529384 RepID=UPI0012BC4850|nr:protein phosphatase CheZ [Roseibium sp. RKSG952]MTH97795.1 chemotaxis protein [Roseibium sp. RKSG952]